MPVWISGGVFVDFEISRKKNARLHQALYNRDKWKKDTFFLQNTSLFL